MEKCYICGCECDNPHHPESSATIDHVMPRMLGGSNTAENKATACLRCNRLKNGNPPVMLTFYAVLLARTMESHGWVVPGSSKVICNENADAVNIEVAMPGSGQRQQISFGTKDGSVVRSYSGQSDLTPALKRKITLATKEVTARLESISEVREFSNQTLIVGTDGKLSVDVKPKAKELSAELDWPSKTCASGPAMAGTEKYEVDKPVSEETQGHIAELKAVETVAFELKAKLTCCGNRGYKLNFTKKSYIQLLALADRIAITTIHLVSGAQHCPSEGVIRSTIAHVNDKFYRNSIDVHKCPFCGEPVFGAIPGKGTVVCKACVKAIKQYLNVQQQLTKMMRFTKGVSV